MFLVSKTAGVPPVDSMFLLTAEPSPRFESLPIDHPCLHNSRVVHLESGAVPSVVPDLKLKGGAGPLDCCADNLRAVGCCPVYCHMQVVEVQQ